MIFTALVQDERADSFRGKGGEVHQQLLSLVDQDKPGDRTAGAFEYALSPEEKVRFSGKLLDRQVKIHVQQWIPGFNGVMRMRGTIREVNGLTADGRAVGK